MTRKQVTRNQNHALGANLRPRRIWVPDIRDAAFAKECGRQSEIVAAADGADPDLALFLDAVLAEAGDP